jgi:hypothetical protein
VSSTSITDPFTCLHVDGGHPGQRSARFAFSALSPGGTSRDGDTKKSILFESFSRRSVGETKQMVPVCLKKMGLRCRLAPGWRRRESFARGLHADNGDEGAFDGVACDA